MVLFEQCYVWWEHFREKIEDYSIGLRVGSRIWASFMLHYEQSIELRLVNFFTDDGADNPRTCTDLLQYELRFCCCLKMLSFTGEKSPCLRIVLCKVRVHIPCSSKKAFDDHTGFSARSLVFGTHQLLINKKTRLKSRVVIA